LGRVVGAVFGVALSVLAVTPSPAANWFEKNFWLPGPDYWRDMPACDFRPALDRIIGDFATKESVFWNSNLRIVGIENIRETAAMTWAAQSVPRRFCAGTALISDGTRHPIYYSTAEDLGMIGMNFEINFCVVGLDRNWSYGPACRAARP
jgi:hypothetical protein